jgi:hypothetical protein
MNNKLVLPAQDPKYDMHRKHWIGGTYDQRCEKVPVGIILVRRARVQPKETKGIEGTRRGGMLIYT